MGGAFYRGQYQFQHWSTRMAGTLRIRKTEDETALHGYRCRGDMIVRMRKV